MEKFVLQGKKLFSEELLVLLLVNLFVYCFAFVYAGANFSIDSYGIMLSDYKGHIEAFVGAYRFSGAGIFSVLLLFGHDPIRNATPAVCIYIMLMVVTTIWLVKRLKMVLEQRSAVAVDMAIVIATVSCWYTDILSFPECILLTGIGTSLTFLAVGLLTETGKQKIRNCFFAFFCLVLATGIYQQYFALFAVYMLAICCVQVLQKEKAAIKEQLMVFVFPIAIWVFSGGVYFILAKAICGIFKVTPNERITNSIGDLFANALHLLRNIHSYIKGRGFFQSEILTVCFAMAFLAFAVCLLKWQMQKKDIRTIFIVGIVTACAILCSMLAAFLSNNRGTRAMFPFFAIYGFMALVAPKTDKKISERIIFVVLILVILLNIGKSVSVEMNLKKTNAVDTAWVNNVIVEIEHYETETGCEIKKVYMCCDDKCDISENESSATRTGYALRAMFELYEKEKDLVVKNRQEYHTIVFGGKNWMTYVPSEQIIFKEHEVYICCY